MKGTIKDRREFDAIYAFGARLHGAHVVLFFLDRERAAAHLGQRYDGETRIGVVASRRVGNAVARNRAKRVLRAAMSETVAGLPRGCRVIAVARRRLIEDSMGSSGMKAEILELLARAAAKATAEGQEP